jgi:hypothetical protein
MNIDFDETLRRALTDERQNASGECATSVSPGADQDATDDKPIQLTERGLEAIVSGMTQAIHEYTQMQLAPLKQEIAALRLEVQKKAGAR